MGENKPYCKINGKIYDLSYVQDVLDGKSDKNITLMLYENKVFDNVISAHTFVYVLKFNHNQIPEDYDEALERFRAYNRRGWENPSSGSGHESTNDFKPVFSENKNKPYCKINGKVYNLSYVQDVLDGKSDKDITLMLYKNKVFESAISASTFEDVLKFNHNQIPEDYDEALEQFRAYNRRGWESKLSCPRCGSTNLYKYKRMSAPNYVCSDYYSREYDYRCESCNCKWKMD